MTQQQIQQLEQHLQQWRALHADLESRRAAYRQQVVSFTLNSMALENEPVDPVRLRQLLNRPAR